MDNTQLRNEIVRIEKKVSIIVGKEVEKIRGEAGDHMANEMLASIACLFMARSVGMIHLWSGEKIEAIKVRVFNTFTIDLDVTVKKLFSSLSKIRPGEGV